MPDDNNRHCKNSKKRFSQPGTLTIPGVPSSTCMPFLSYFFGDYLLPSSGHKRQVVASFILQNFNLIQIWFYYSHTPTFIIIIIIHGLLKTFKLVAIGKITLNLQNLHIKQ